MWQTAFFEAHGLVCTTFSGWRQRMRMTLDVSAMFAEVELPPPNPPKKDRLPDDLPEERITIIPIYRKLRLE